MFCNKCGVENPDASKFCVACGSILSTNKEDTFDNTSEPYIPQPPTIDDLPEVDVSDNTVIHCPKCKSKKIQALTETDVKGGYRAGRGCLGYLIFGPLGFLCGACGQKAKISTINHSSFICMECGRKFIELEEMIEGKEKEVKYNLILCIGLAIASIILLPVIGPSSLVCLLLAGGAFVQYRESKRDCEDLVVNGYDAVCYCKIKQ